jgi:hypothetical protein
MTANEKLKDFLVELSEQEMIICNKDRFVESLKIKSGKLIERIKKLVAAIGGGAAGAGAGTAVFFANAGAMTKFLIFIGLSSIPITYPLVGLAIGASAGYVISKKLDDAEEGVVKKIPKYINSPLDLIASSWIDLLSTILVKILTVDKNYLTENEREFLVSLFEEKYGYCRKFLESYFRVRELSIEEIRRLDYTFISQTLKDLSRREKGIRVDEVILTIISEVKAAIELDGQITDRELEEFQRLSRSLSRR